MAYTTVFKSGGSQAVRIPAAFRFDTDRVTIEAVDGGVLLRPAKKKPTWDEFFRLCDECHDELKDFLVERPGNEIPAPEDIFA